MTIVALDVGKSNVRLVATDDTGNARAILSRENAVLPGPPYPHFDVDGLFAWIVEGLASFAGRFEIDAIVPVAHGACGAAIGADGHLVLPILDYEHPGPGAAAGYEAQARRFEETGSPALPDGLNLGRQFHWLAQEFPENFARARHLLAYPQFFAHWLTGVACSEVTSLGCHTDLWSPGRNEPSAFARRRGFAALLPPLVPAWERIGTVTPAIALATGLSPGCAVLAGIHDSNASYLCHRAARSEPFAVVSSGTWIIVMSRGGKPSELPPERDTLVNVDAFGDPVPTARFMGGREYEVLAGRDGLAGTPSAADVASLVARGTIPLPGFTAHGGPFRARVGAVAGPVPRSRDERAALASLYTALVTDYCLDLVGASGDVIVEGRFAHNAAYTAVLAALRHPGPVLRSDDEIGTLRGAAILARWPRPTPGPRLERCAPDAGSSLALEDYRDRWRALAEQA